MNLNLKNRLLEKICNADYFYSFEIHPVKHENDVDKLLKSVCELCTITDPLFLSITWHATLNPYELCRSNSSMSLASSIVKRCQTSILAHLTCGGVTLNTLISYIDQLKRLNIHNIFALRGDTLDSASASNSQTITTAEFVKFISDRYTNTVLAVAGYPDIHPKAVSRASDLANLKRKVDAGAHFIITQFFFHFDSFAAFVYDCRREGIKVPIIPGIFLFESSETIRRIAKMNKIIMPADIENTLQQYGTNLKLVENYALHLAYDLCNKLFESKLCTGIHIFTMNRTQSTAILLNKLGFTQRVDIDGHKRLNQKDDCGLAC